MRPPAGTKIDWSHPLARGLSTAFAFNEGGRAIVDLAVGKPFAATTNPTLNALATGPVINANGRAIETSDDGSRDAYAIDWSGVTGPDVQGGTGEAGFSVFTVIKVNAKVFSVSPIVQGNQAISGSSLRIGATDKLEWYANSAMRHQGTETVPTFPSYNKIGATWQENNKGATLLNGGAYESTADAGNAFLGPLTTIAEAGSDGGLRCELSLYLVWGGRVLSETELRAIDANPWQIFKPQRIHVPIPKYDPLAFTNILEEEILSNFPYHVIEQRLREMKTLLTI